MSRETGVATAPVKYPPHSPLRAALNARVADYFRRTGRSRHGGPRMWLKSALIFAWLAASWALLVFWASTWWQAIPLTVSLALAVAGVGFNVQHDGGHGAYARRRGGNRLSARALDLIGGSSYVWSFKHNVIHHQYTNIEGVDTDLESEPFLRLAPGQRRRVYHRFQHVYVWLLYAFFPPKWVFWDDFHNVIRGRIGNRPFPRPRGRELAVLVAGKLVHVGWILIVPLALHPWTRVLPLYALFCFVLGATLATAFQLAHCVGEAEFRVPPEAGARMDACWVEHQLATTVDFAPRSRWLTWYLGGLNYQIEHHLFPRISHVHYPALAGIVRGVCFEHGARHRTQDTLGEALRSHLGWLKRMGRPHPG